MQHSRALQLASGEPLWKLTTQASGELVSEGPQANIRRYSQTLAVGLRHGHARSARPRSKTDYTRSMPFYLVKLLLLQAYPPPLVVVELRFRERNNTYGWRRITAIERRYIIRMIAGSFVRRVWE